MTLYHYSVHNKIYTRYCGVLWAENPEAAERAVAKKHNTTRDEKVEITTIIKPERKGR